MTSADLNNKAQTLLKRENRYLKVGGLICIALAAPALFYLSEQVELKSWQQYETLWEFAPLALVYFCGANLFALGLIVLFAGFSDLPLFRNARARKGLLVKLAGANLLTVTFALLFFGDPVWAEESWVHSLGYLLGLGLFAVFARAGVVLIRRGWKHDAIGAEKLLEQDTRRPVVYVRSSKMIARSSWLPAFDDGCQWSLPGPLPLAPSRSSQSLWIVSVRLWRSADRASHCRN